MTAKLVGSEAASALATANANHNNYRGVARQNSRELALSLDTKIPSKQPRKRGSQVKSNTASV